MLDTLQRLKDLDTRKDFAALDRFRNAMCGADQACLAPDLEHLLLRFPGSSKHKRASVSYEGISGNVEWTLNGRRILRDRQLQRTDLLEFPKVITACGTDHIPVRTAKIHAAFREKLLRQMLAGQRVLCNMVLFHCTTCNNRFPAFHPDHKPEFSLDCLKNCSK